MSLEGDATSSRSARVALLLVSLLPAYVIAVLIERFAVNVPIWDSWSWSVSRYVANDLPSLRLGKFWELRNEHRLFVPQLLETAIGHLTSLNMIVLMYVKLACTGVLFLALLGLYVKTSGATNASWMAIVASLWLFSLAQWPRWIDSRHLPTTLAMIGLALGAWSLCSGAPGWRRLLLAGAAAYLSSLSYFSGNLTWIALGLLLWSNGYRKRGHYAAWAAMTLSVWIPYAYDFASAKSLTREGAAPAIGELAQFVLVFLGSPLVGTDRLADRQSAALLFGALGVSTCFVLAFACRRSVVDGARRSMPWLVIAGWVVVNASAAGYGRFSQFGVSGARSIRYTVYGCFFWLAVSALIGIALTGRRRDRLEPAPAQKWALGLWPGATLVLVAVGYVNGTVAVLAGGQFGAFSDRLAQGRHCLTTPETATDACLQLLAPKPSLVRSLLPELARRRVSFLYLETELSFEEAVVQGRFQSRAERQRMPVAGVVEDVLVTPPPTFVNWRRLHLPRASSIVLRTGVKVELLGLEDEPLQEVTFVVAVLQGGEPTELGRAQVGPVSAAEPFVPLEVDLTSYGGTVIDLQLSTRPAGGGPGATYQRAFWRHPKIDYGPPGD